MKKYFVITSIILLFILPIFFNSPEITSAHSIIDTGEVTATSLNIREKPSTSAKVIGGLRKGNKINIYEKSGSWYKTKINNRWGYVHRNYVKLSGSGNAVSGAVEVTASNLNVREKTSTSSRIIGSLRRGTKIDYYEKTGKWYKVKVNDKWGYIHGNYVKVVSSSGSSNGSSSAGKVQGSVEVTASNLNVREKASTSSRIIGSLRRGTKVDYYEKTGKWYKVKVNGKWGYIHGDYVKVTTSGSSSSGNSSLSKVQGTGEVTASNLNVREKASTSSRIIGSLRRGTKVDYYEKTGKWYKVKVNGKWGYIHGDYVKVIRVSNDNNNPSSASSTMTGEVTASCLNVRQSNSTSSKVIGSLLRGTQIHIEEKIGRWYKIKYNNRTGYVHGDYILILEDSNLSQKQKGNLKGKKIFLDPGHGGHDPGAVANSVQEKVLTLAIAKKIKSRLEDAGATVVMSRTSDKFVHLSERVRLANNSSADVFISVHLNSFVSEAANGIEVFYDTVNEGTRSRNLATEVQHQLVSQLGLKDRGIIQRNFEVIRYTRMPSVLVEFGFITNRHDLSVIQNEQDKIAEAIYAALIRYFE